MKLCKLKLKNLNSFRKEIELDFEQSPLDDASLVAITGPTGAGKTTLLDAICVALYGKTPRLSGTGSQNPNHLVSHGEKEGFAEVHFIASGTRYIANWSVRQGGSPRGQLSYAEDNKLISDKLSTRGKSLGSSQNTVSEEIESILGLDFDAFRRSVMLAQGEFAAFLKANNEDRRTILEATAGIGIYDVLKQVLNEKVNEVEAEHQEVLQKLGAIPDVSREQLAEAEKELDRLRRESETLDTESQQIQEEKTRETKRKEDFEKLKVSEKRQKELSDKQPEIDTRQAEQENAERAERLRPEKQTFDTATSEFSSAEKALGVATTEKIEAEKQVETDQVDFDTKETAYQAASAERDRKGTVYTEAKTDVERAEERFAEVDKRNPNLADLDNQIEALLSQLDDKQTERFQLAEKTQTAQTFLDENPLPLDRRQRLTRATGLLVELGSQEKQLETASTSKAEHEREVSALKQEIKKLSDTRTGFHSEKADAETTLENATAELNKLLTTGTDEEWNAGKQAAVKAQPIAQKYEATQDNLVDAENQLNALNGTATTLDVELGQIETDLASQTDVYQRAEEAVQHCEDTLKFMMLANPINQLRQHLHAGEPCRVCGATEHPYADVVEDENEGLLQDAETALAAAKTDAQASQNQFQALTTKHTQTEQNRRNIAEQIKDCGTEIEKLRSKIAQLLTEWQAIYPDAGVSFDWITEQINEADTAIADLGKAKQTHTQAAHDYQTASQQLKVCENDIINEKKVLRETEEQLQNTSNAVEDLKLDIKSIETRFWELLPDPFHSFAPKEAVEQFDNKIEDVEKRESELSRAKSDLKLLNAGIETDQSNLEGLKDRHEALQSEIDGYQREGEAFLEAVREKTGGLETETEINAAIENLETELQSKEGRRDAAEQQLQNSQNLLTQKQTTHRHCEEQCEESTEKLEMARSAYFDKLRDAGFDSPEAHDAAFRDEVQMQKLTDQIDAHEDEKRQLGLDIVELKTRFEENPFDSEALGRITTQIEEIQAQLQTKREDIGTQRKIISDLKDALERREALADELHAAQQELERWQRLQETIPKNDLRDFALEIMFRQMGNLANDQLKYLTSERYQLKVESIGDLTVIDRWNANEERPVETLSGGESFLTSLALALALSDLSRGRAQLNSLFLDEGFGTLDTETLDIAIAALEGLRIQGRSIFLISHIQELTRRLPVKINVRKQGDGSSSVDIRG